MYIYIYVCTCLPLRPSPKSIVNGFGSHVYEFCLFRKLVTMRRTKLVDIMLCISFLTCFDSKLAFSNVGFDFLDMHLLLRMLYT